MAASKGDSIEIGQSEQELVGSKKSNSRKYLLIGGAAAVVIAVVVVLIVVLTGGEDDTKDNGNSSPVIQQGDPITLEDFLTGKLSSRGFSGDWSPSGKVISRDDRGSVLAYDPVTNETKTLLGPDREDLLQGFKFDLSADERYLLVARGYGKIFRHSFLAVYDIVDLVEGCKNAHPKEELLKLKRLCKSSWSKVIPVINCPLPGVPVAWIQPNVLFLPPSVPDFPDGQSQGR